jgi:hypothetical protein
MRIHAERAFRPYLRICSPHTPCLGRTERGRTSGAGDGEFEWNAERSTASSTPLPASLLEVLADPFHRMGERYP